MNGAETDVRRVVVGQIWQQVCESLSHEQRQSGGTYTQKVYEVRKVLTDYGQANYVIVSALLASIWRRNPSSLVWNDAGSELCRKIEIVATQVVEVRGIHISQRSSMLERELVCETLVILLAEALVQVQRALYVGVRIIGNARRDRQIGWYEALSEKAERLLASPRLVVALRDESNKLRTAA